MLRWKSLFANSSDKGRLPKGVRRKQRAHAELSRRSRLEPLEDRCMLAVDVFIDAVTSFVTIKDESGLTGGDTVQEDNQVTLAFANMDPDPTEGAGAQDGLLITDPDGVNALGAGVFQVSATEVFVPEQFDAMAGVGVNLQDSLTVTVVIDLQDNDDTLTIADNIDDVPVVDDFDIRGGSNGGGSDVLVLNGIAGNQDDIQIQPSATVLGEQTITGLGATQTVSGIEHILFNGQDADNDNLTVNLGLGEATARVQHAVAANADEVVSDRLPTIQFTQVNDFVLEGGQRTTVATFVMDVLNNNRLEGADTYRFVSNDQDTLVIESESDDDRITVSLDANGDLQIFDTDVTINTTRMIPNDNLHINTGGGDDTVTIDVTGTELISTPILYDGGNGTDILRTIGNPTPADVDVRYTPGPQPDQGRLAYDDNNGAADPNGDNDGLFADMRIDFDNLEPIEERTIANSLTVVGTGADNAISYSVGSTTNRGLVSIDGFESIEFQGKTNLALLGMGGDDTIVVNNANLPNNLTQIGILGGDGDDTIRLESLPDASATTFIGVASAAGEAGDDLIDASGITVATPLALVGGAGNDTITGGAGADTIVGGTGDDTFVDSPGNDSYDGSTGNDTLLFRGTLNDDVIDVTQTDPTTVTLSSDLDPTTFTTETLTLGTIQQLRIEALDGDDLIRIGHADAFSDNDLVTIPPSQSISFVVEGNAPNASDRLVVQDAGLGDLVIHRLGADERSGSVTVGGGANMLAPVDYSGIEFVDVAPANNITGGTGIDGLGQLVVFKSDPYEANNTLANATFLGSGATLNVDPTIDPAGIPAFGIPGDSDFYRFVAETTGTLDLQVYFEEIPTLANGRPGLPNNGDLDIQLYDGAGTLIAGAGPLFGGNNGGGTNPELNNDGDASQENERIRLPVVAGETYYLRVFGNVNAAGVGAINVYNITVLNEAPPVPFDLELNDIIQVGTVNNAVAPTPTVFRANLAPVNGVLPPTGNDFIGKTVEFTSGPNLGRSAMITAFNSVMGQFTVGAGLLTAPAATDTFIVESTDTGRSQLDDATRDNTPIITFRLNDNILLNDVPGNPGTATPPDEVIPIPFNGATTAAAVAAAAAASAGFRVPVFIEGAPQQPGQTPLTPIGYAVPLTGVPGVYTFDFGTNAINGAFVLADGSHFISAGVEIIDPAAAAQFGYGARSQSLEIVVDSTVPQVFFGDPLNVTDGLHPDSDTGVSTNAATLSDRITSDTTPTFFGQAEANSIVKAYVDVDGSNSITAADVLIGQSVAIPLDGTNQEPFGRWEITTSVNMNDQLFTGFGIGPDGPRTILVSAEDVAGNTAAAALPLTIFLDTQGPQITGVSVNQEATAPFGGYDLFDPKPSINGPSPLVSSITINFADLPLRSDVAGTANDSIYPALDPTIAGTIGNYSVVGDANGQIVITSATVNQAVRLSGTVTAAAVAGATTVTDAGLAAGTVAGDFIVFNNGAAAGRTRQVTNVAGGVLTIDAAFGLAQAVGDGFSIVPAASILNAGALLPNPAAQSAITSTANTTTTFTVANIAPVTGPVVGDYVYINTGVNAGQIQRVSAVAGGTTITVANAFAAAPAAGDTITLIDPTATGFGTTALNTASVTLTFAAPLPDDRFSVTVSDNLVDPVGNQLDGESNATTPTATPTFPTGDGVAGGAFAGRFTIDARPEIGVWAAGIAQIDINGNLQYDPTNVDATNRDLDFQIGFSSDNVFAGKFGVSPVTGFATGFDTLAAYGRVGNQWRWMIDTNHDGTITAGTDIVNNDGLNINGMPVAGNFSTANPTDGDEIGVFDGSTWYLDTNRSFTIDAGDTTVGANYNGYPIVGDFNGDGVDDLGAYTAVTNQFGGNLVSIDTNRDGLFDIQFRVGFGGGNANGFNMFPGVRERAVAADMDADGIDDIGFWVPDGTALNPGDQGEWYFLVSGGNSLLNRVSNNFLAYTTTPFGNDFKASFGNSFAVPLVGNFDPPVVASSGLVNTAAPTNGTTEVPATRQAVDTVRQTTTTQLPPEVPAETVDEAPVAITEPEVTSEVVPPAEAADPEPTPTITPIGVTTREPINADPVVDELVVEDVPEPETAPPVEEVDLPADEAVIPTEITEPDPVVEAQPAATVEPSNAPVSPATEQEPVETVAEAPILPPEPSNEPEAKVTSPSEPFSNEAPIISEELVVNEPVDEKLVDDEPAVVEPPALDQPGVPETLPTAEAVENSPVEQAPEATTNPIVESKPVTRRVSSANWWSSSRKVRNRVTTPAASPVSTPVEKVVASPISTEPVVEATKAAVVKTTPEPAPTLVVAVPTSTPPVASTPKAVTTKVESPVTPAVEESAAPNPPRVVQAVAIAAAETQTTVATPTTTAPAATTPNTSLRSLAFAMSITGGKSSTSHRSANHYSQSASISTSDLAEYNANTVDAAFSTASDFRATETLSVDDHRSDSSSYKTPRYAAFAALAKELFRF